MATAFAFSNLPVELVRDILEHAAHADRATARNLTLVSSAVRHWTDPILYDTVVLSTARSLRAFVAAISNKPSEFVRTHVRNLGIFTLGPVQSIDRVLKACAGVHSLACGFSLPSYMQTQGTEALQSLKRPREQHLLGVACRDGWDASLVGRTVTHLRIHLTSFDSSRPDSPFAFSGAGGQEAGWDRLRALPSLTHLAVVYKPSGSTSPTDIIPHLSRLLPPPPSSTDARSDDGLPSLQLVLIQVVGTAKDASFAGETVNVLNAAAESAGGPARRIVAELAPLSAARQWEESVRGGQSVWDSAEAVVQKRLASSSK
ncbi:hypothetical protein PYCCODRAFT_1430975 [Trametes coccinea BRFM310]|uniref:F-box domain-containing protein n=1 Tax=Trametes coccinea (strain BRFM310) TaxID=1353009 RepID=A0A1Y2J057_TRAC3|nr:hypothetical protein PYCCODRAFT_1430975 [Trametes coccinea BRFM310]